MEEKKDNIDEIINDFNKQKENKLQREIEPLEPPKKRQELIDFSKENVENNANINPENVKEKKKKEKPVKTPKEIEALKAKRKEHLTKIKKLIFNKKVLLALTAVILVVAAVFGIQYAINYSKTAYLKPYEEKYPDTHFPVGIMEKYCDEYANNKNLVGHLIIEDIDVNIPITTKNAEKVTAGATQFNYVIYLKTKKLEKIYKDASAFNSSSKCISYSNLFDDMDFQIVGAFYTNTKAKDDNGYIFPYNVTEVMTQDSFNQYFDRLNSRFIYNVKGLSIDKSDTLLTISCPTDYKKDYRFVLVCKAADKNRDDLVAVDKPEYHLTQSEYDKLNKENPYRFSSKWYPEIITTDKSKNEVKIKKSIKDYE